MTSLGKKMRMSKLFDANSGNAVIIPMDHGVEGYFEELCSPKDLVKTLAAAGANGFLTRRGLAALAGDRFGGAGWVQRITGRSGIAVSRQINLDNDQLFIASVEQALRNGADCVVPTVFLGGPQEPQVLPGLGAISDKCQELGLPVMMEVFPVGDSDAVPYNGPYTLDDMRVAVRIAAEEGADCIKTWYSGDPKTFRQIVSYAYVPVLIAGGPKAENTREVLEMVKGAMDAGARGTTVGRKIWQSPNPGAMVRAVSMIVHEGADVDRALRILN
jgi:fructose-bisphosphate aldolase / 2-amino-3,7-dideoxy-D-threo-hept-6-ulosonate synthase